MASKRDQAEARHKIATMLALVEDSDQGEFAQAVSLAKSLRFSDEEANIIATAMRNKYKKSLVADIRKEAEGLGILDIPGLFPGMGPVDKNKDGRIDDLADKRAPEDEIADIAEEAEIGDSAVDVTDELPVKPEKEPEVEFAGEADDTDAVLEPGAPVTIELPAELGTMTLSLDDNDLDIAPDVEDIVNGEPEMGALPEVEDEVPPMDIEEDIVPDEVDVVEEEGEMPKAAAVETEKQEIQAKVEDIKPSTEKPLGADTANMSMGTPAKPFSLDGTHDVAAPDEAGDTMSLTGSNPDEGDNKTFLGFDVPTALLDDRFLNPAAKGTLSLEGAGGELVQQFKDLGLDDGTKVPTQPGDKDFMGWDKSFENFGVPTQNPPMAGQRKTTVAKSDETEDVEETPEATADVEAAAEEESVTAESTDEDPNFVQALTVARAHLVETKHAEMLFAENADTDTLRGKIESSTCDACENEPGMKVAAVKCHDCGTRVALCETDQKEGYCPGCASIDKVATQMATEAAVSQQLLKDYGDEGIDAGDHSVTNDPNGDGGFKTTDPSGKPKDKNARDMGVHEGEWDKDARVENARLKQALKDKELTSARRETALTAAFKMVQAGIIADDEIDMTVEKLLADGTTVTAMKHVTDHIVNLAQKLQTDRAKDASITTTPTTPVPGLARNFVMASKEQPLVAPNLKESLKDVFTHPDATDYDENGRLRR